MAGHVFSITLLDGLLAQSYYSPHVLSVIQRLIFSNRLTQVEKVLKREQNKKKGFLRISNSLKDLAHRVHPQQSEGRPKNPGSTSSTSTSTFMPSTPGTGAGDDDDLESPEVVLPIQNTCLHSLQVPTILVGHTYGQLFSRLANQEMIVMGIYRTIGIGGDRSIALTILNPSSEMILVDDDQIFVLSNQPH
jgi:hypothetical protein